MRKVPHSRQRYGCDRCKGHIATEAFIGTLDHELWLCLDCVKSLQTWTEREKENAWKGGQR